MPATKKVADRPFYVWGTLVHPHRGPGGVTSFPVWNMSMIRPTILLAASFVAWTSVQAAPRLKPEPVDLERMLHGEWVGPACGGEWTFGAEVTFAVRHYSPGNNEFAGTWKVRRDSLPPTLVLTCKESDAPDRIKVGEASEVKLIELSDDALAYQYSNGHKVRYVRPKK